MRTVDSDRAVLAVLALPLAAVSLAGGLLAVSSLDDAREVRHVRTAAAVVPDLLRLQQALATERAVAVTALAAGRAASGPSSARTTTTAALTRATEALRSVRGNPRPTTAAELASTLQAVRHAIDTGRATASSVQTGYGNVADVVAAFPATVAATVGEDRLARPTAVLAARLRAADAVAAQQLAGDRLLRAGRSVTRADLDALAGRTAALDRALTDLAATGVGPASDGVTSSDAVWSDPGLRADLARLRSGAAVRSGLVAWDAAGSRLTAALATGARAAADDVTTTAAGLLRVHALRASAALLGALTVVAVGIGHGLRVSRRFGRDLVTAAVRGAGDPYATTTRPLGWGPATGGIPLPRRRRPHPAEDLAR